MKKAMLFVSFGSSYESARRDNIDKVILQNMMFFKHLHLI